VKVIPIARIETKRKTYLRWRPDLSVVRSIAANEAIITVLQSSMLNESWVVSLKVVIILIKTTRTVNTTDRADILSGSSVDTSSVVDVLNLSSGMMTAVAVEAAIDAATTRAVLEDAILGVDVASSVGVLTVIADGEIVGNLVDAALAASHQRLVSTGAAAVDTTSGRA
jgi:hypothetical protein